MGCPPCQERKDTFIFLCCCQKWFLQLTSDCALLQWGRLQKQPPPSSNEAPGKETERGLLSRCHLKKLRFESFLPSPQEKLPAFVSEWGKCRDVNCVGTAHAVVDRSVSLFASVCGLDIDFRVGRLDWCLC